MKKEEYWKSIENRMKQGEAKLAEMTPDEFEEVEQTLLNLLMQEGNLFIFELNDAQIAMAERLRKSGNLM